MPAAEPYVDTSALAKRYIDETGSEDIDAFLADMAARADQSFGGGRVRCVLQRRRRAAEIDAAYERAALADFADDIRSGYFEVEPLADRHAVVAHELVGQLSDHSLRTLDALHLAIAQSAGVKVLATADRAMARAAEALGIRAVTFG